MYQAEARRRRLREASADVGAYLASLEIQVRIEPADEPTLPRAAQLTQRTNQFNLTTCRYSESELRALHESASNDVLLVRLSDRFGDYGIVGVAILRHRPDQTVIDTFLMSCRALGRGAEEALLTACLKVAGQRKSPAVHGHYIPTKKNELVRDFFDQRGFQLIGESSGERRYLRDLNQPMPPWPPHLESVEVQLPEPHV
jgi:FkbH-like protein